MSISQPRLSAHPAPPPTRAVAAPRPRLGVTDAFAIVVGTVIGVGIFRTPAVVAANAGSEAMLILAWAVGGLVSLTGALCYAELASAYPDAGGDYHYLLRAFGRRVSFLFAWARLTVVQTGSVALLGFVLGDYASGLLPLGPHSAAIYAALVVVLFTALHIRGVSHGTRTQNVLTAVEILGVLLLVVAGLSRVGAPMAAGTAGTADTSVGSLALVMVFVLLTYGGWNEAAYVSAEVRDPAHTITRALVLGIVTVTVLYVLVNVAYLRGLGLQGVATSRAPAADLLGVVVGGWGATVMSLLVIVSSLTSINASLFTGARTAYALGRDVPAFACLGRWDGPRGTPVNALLTQAAIALPLVLLGASTRSGFETMVAYTAPVFWGFFLLTGCALFVLRRREPAVARPFRVPLYPLTPLVFCGTCAYLLYASVAYTGLGALVGMAVVAVGALVLLVTHRTPSPRGG